MIERARELSKVPNTFWTDQFNNADNRNAYHNMAKEMKMPAKRQENWQGWKGYLEESHPGQMCGQPFKEQELLDQVKEL